MDVMEWFKVVFLGIVQGITEWLPVSSTGHMILVETFLPFKNMSKTFYEVFLVVIQFGSILAVLTLYFHKLNPFSPSKTPVERKNTWTMWFKVLVAVLPAAVVGLLFDDWMTAHFYNAATVAVTLIVYGILFIVIENRKKKPKITDIDSLSYKTALGIGTFQVLSLIPGTSRSGSTILGAIILGTGRDVAAEFSFFLAIPVMFGASLLKLVKNGFAFSGMEYAILLVGMAVAYVVSLFAIRFLMSYVRKHDFKVFGWYRIVLGIVVILAFMLFK